MGDWDKPVKGEKEAVESFVKQKEEDTVLYSDDDIFNEFKEKKVGNSKVCCLVYGEDGTGKSGLVFDYLTEEDIKAGNKMVIIDLDGGSQPLLERYHKDKEDSIYILDPLVTKETTTGTEIDYKKTFAKIRAIIRFVKNNYAKEKIKAVVFDGLSTALKFAEGQMRIEKNIAPDGGVQMGFWKRRNKLISETLTQLKTIPIAKFLIGHTNFIMDKDKDVSAIVVETNAMMLQKIRCSRNDNPSEVEFSGVVDKNKYEVTTEGKRFVFCTVSKGEDRKCEWDTKEVLNAITK